MPESVHFGLTTAFVRQQFQLLVAQQGSLAKAITSLLNRDKFLTSKYRFRSLAKCEVWQEILRPGVDSLANLSSVLHMLDTYVKFNRLESRSAAIEELLQAIPSEEGAEEDRFIDDKLSDADVGLGDSWNPIQGENIEKSSAISMLDAQTQIEDSGKIMDTINSYASIITMDTGTQTCESIFTTIASTDVYCQTEPCTKEASVQTEPFSLKLCAKEKNSSKNDIVAKSTPVQSDPIRYLAPAIKKLMSPIQHRKKNSGFTSDNVVAAKRPRKAPPTKTIILPVTSSSKSSTTSSSISSPLVTVNNQVFSGAPMFNSIAPSQPASFKSSIPSLPGNVYVYRGQPTGMPISMSPMHPQRRSFILNPRVVLSPLPILNPHDSGSQSDLFRNRFEKIGNQTLAQPYYSLPCPQNTIAQPPKVVTGSVEDPIKKITANINPSIPVFSPAHFSKVNSDILCKRESSFCDGFPVSNVAASAFQPISSQNELLRKHLQQKQSMEVDTILNINTDGNARSTLESKEPSETSDHSYSTLDL